MFHEGYLLEIFKSKCDSNAKGVHCFVLFKNDISEVLTSFTLKHYGKRLTFHPEKIALNALKNQQEAEKIADWHFREINETWERGGEIQPSTDSAK